MRRSGGARTRSRWKRIGLRLPKLAPKKVEDHEREKYVNDREDDERNHDPFHRCDRFLRAHHSVNDPRLATQLSYYPAQFSRQKTHRSSDNQTTKKPGAAGNPAVFPPTPPD